VHLLSKAVLACSTFADSLLNFSIFQHTVHVVKDPNSETGFKGLPPGWADLLKTNKITKEDVKEHGDAIIDILRFHQEQVQ
jgi:hypothetical protein